MNKRKNICKHKWIFDGKHEVIVKKPEEQIIFINGSLDPDTNEFDIEPKIILKEFKYNPIKLLFHCEKCAKLKWKKVEE